MTIRVLVAEDNALIRQVISGIVRAAKDMELLAEVDDGDRAFDLAMQLAPDVLVLDVELPGKSGDTIARLLHHNGSPAKMLLLSAHADQALIQELLRSNVHGYLVKDEAVKCLAPAIRQVAQGEMGWFGSRYAEVDHKI
jgi:two-component system, NarL family, response regulator DesR